jgi:predicted NBD/HSP70 family sugar kinase
MFAGEDVLLGLAGLEGSPPGAVRLAATALAERVRQGDARTERALGEVGFWLGVALAGAINLLNPQAVVLGGYLGALAPWLEPPISAQLEERVLAADCGPCSILASELGEDAAVQGAAALALKDLIADPLSVGPLVAAAAR